MGTLFFFFFDVADAASPLSHVKKEEKKYVLLPSEMFHQRWQMLLSVIAAYNAFIIPYRIAFLFQQELDANGLLVVDILIDVLLVAHVIIASRTAYVEQGFFVCEPRLILKKYIRSGAILKDAIICFPLGTFNITVNTSNYVRLWCIILLTRLLIFSFVVVLLAS